MMCKIFIKGRHVSRGVPGGGNTDNGLKFPTPGVPLVQKKIWLKYTLFVLILLHAVIQERIINARYFM